MTHAIPSAAVAAAVLVLCTPLCGQAVVQVQGGGQALHTAAQGAAPGTVFVLQPGRYDAFPWSVVDAKIFAPQRASLVGYFVIPPAAGSLEITNVDVVLGTRMGPHYSYPSPGRISTTADLVLDNCTAEGLTARACSVSAANCSFGSDSTPVALIDVEAAITDSTVTSGIYTTYLGPFAYAENAMGVRDSILRMERVSVTAVSYAGGGGTPGAGQALIVTGNSTLTLADCQLRGGPAGPGFGAGRAVSVAAPARVTLSPTTTTATGTGGPFAVAPLATARWTTPGLALGRTATAKFRDTASTPVAALLAWDFVRVSTPLAAEPLFVLGTPNWYPWSFGVTDAQGNFSVPVSVPNFAGLRYQSVWFTGLFLGALPARSTAPLGGVIR